MKVNNMSRDDINADVEEKSKIFVLPNKKEESIIDDSDKKELTPRVAAYRICRSIQNIYLEISSQQDK